MTMPRAWAGGLAFLVAASGALAEARAAEVVRITGATGLEIRSFEATAAPGEFATLALRVETGADAPTVSVEIGDLQGPSGAKLARGEARLLRAIPARVTLGASRRPAVVPEWLVPIGRGLPRGGAVEVRVLLRAPQKGPSGPYAGALRVIGEAGATLKQIPVRLTVLPFELSRPKALMAMLYTYEFRYLERYDPDFVPQPKRRPASERAGFVEQGRAMVRDMAEHGMTAIFPHSSLDLLRKDGGLQFPDLEMSLKTAREEGMTGLPGFFIGNLLNAQWADVPRFDPRRDPPLCLEVATRVGAIAKAAGFPGIVVVPSDEPNDTNGRKLPVARQLLKAAQGAAGVQFGVTSGSERFESPKALGDLHKVSIFEAQAPPAAWDEMKRSGHDVWIYENDTTEGHSPLWSRFVFGVWGWRTGLDGITAWTHPLYTFDPYWERPRVDADGHAVPERDDTGRPIGTIEWEGIREGVDDRRYLDTLSDAIEEARSRKAPTAAAEAVLADLRKTVDPALAGYTRRRSEMGDPPAPFDAAWFAAMRARVAAAVVSLGAKTEH